MVRLFASGGLSPRVASQLMGAGAEMERAGNGWQIGSASGRELMVLDADAMDQPANDARLVLELASGLLLGHLEKVLGGWKLVHSSKQSSVRFRFVGQSGREILVYAHLFTPEPAPGSPVVAIQFRLDSATGPGD